MEKFTLECVDAGSKMLNLKDAHGRSSLKDTKVYYANFSMVQQRPTQKQWGTIKLESLQAMSFETGKKYDLELKDFLDIDITNRMPGRDN